APVRVQQRVHIFYHAEERDKSQHASDYASAIDADIYLVLRNKSLIHSSSMALLSQHYMQTAAYLIDIALASWHVWNKALLCRGQWTLACVFWQNRRCAHNKRNSLKRTASLMFGSAIHK